MCRSVRHDAHTPCVSASAAAPAAAVAVLLCRLCAALFSVVFRYGAAAGRRCGDTLACERVVRRSVSGCGDAAPPRPVDRGLRLDLKITAGKDVMKRFDDERKKRSREEED
ncbi:hypothetical protein JOB18_004263 [Solea senegalensis]|uniref:Secreted protein n=1 Tax=Solea senegalensis TaxID=28829 RepID=A0AAV6SP78_SOLSE|nr:hypothetical protein JOB18_004263 [Solea senegalensis]